MFSAGILNLSSVVSTHEADFQTFSKREPRCIPTTYLQLHPGALQLYLQKAFPLPYHHVLWSVRSLHHLLSGPDRQIDAKAGGKCLVGQAMCSVVEEMWIDGVIAFFLTPCAAPLLCRSERGAGSDGDGGHDGGREAHNRFTINDAEDKM